MIDLNLDDLDIDLDDKPGAVAVESGKRIDIDSYETAREVVAEASWQQKKATLPKNVLHFDLETIPDYSRLELFGLEQPPELPPVTPIDQCYAVNDWSKCTLAALKKLFEGKRYPKEWLDACREVERAAEKPRSGAFELLDEAEKAEDANKAAWAEWRKTMAVCPEMAMIVALGWGAGGDEPDCIISDPNNNAGLFANEGEILEKFWSLAGKYKSLCGYNIAGFDLPTIYVRSAFHHITPPKRFDLKPWSGDVIDLMQIRFPRSGAKRLKDLARMLQIPVPAGDVEGSQVEDLIKAGELKTLAEYVRSDVSITQCLHSLYRGYFI